MEPSGIKLVLLPGMYGSTELFADFEKALPREFVTERVGYPNDVSLSYAELLELVRSCVPVSESYVIVAESFSTPLAIQFAGTNPPNMKGLVLSAGFATSPVRGLLRFMTPFLAPFLSHLPVNEFGATLTGAWIDRAGDTADAVADGDRICQPQSPDGSRSGCRCLQCT